jgi:dihydropteroate synthase
MNRNAHDSPMPTTWRIGPQREMNLSQARIIGILNVTPDSFSDGGQFASVEAAVEHATRLVAEGADMIDIGGESTRPGASRIAVIEQLRRVIPVVESIRRHSAVAISIDTTRHDVAEAALNAGADVINDVSAGREEPRMIELAAERGCGLILMHRIAPPDADQYSTAYTSERIEGDVAAIVGAFLAERRRAAVAVGVDPKSIVLDPGLGFGKTVSQNFQLVARFSELMKLGSPLLSAASRKSFIGKASGVESPPCRINGSLAVTVAHALAGVRLFRVHDVAAHRQALGVAAAIASARSCAGHAGGASDVEPLAAAAT